MAGRNIVAHYEDISLSNHDIMRMLRCTGKAKQTLIIFYDSTKRFRSLQELFGGHKFVIVLLKLQGSEVGHWVLLIDHGDHYEHFDSYGLNIDEEIAITHEPRYLSMLMSTATKHVISSSHRFQRHKHHINTCARWVVVRINTSGLSLDLFKKFIDSGGKDGDKSVTLMTLLM